MPATYKHKQQKKQELLMYKNLIPQSDRGYIARQDLTIRTKKILNTWWLSEILDKTLNNKMLK